MPYTLELRKDLATIFGTIRLPLNIMDELPTASQEVMHILDQSNRPLYYISDVSQLADSLTLDDLIKAANVLVRGPYAFASHPNFRALILITNDSLTSLAATGLRSDSFGNVQVEIFATMEDALAFVHSHP